MKLRFLLPVAIAVLSFACKPSSTPADSSVNPEPAASSQSENPGKYEIKSGIVVYKALIMGMETTQTLYFDDYGKKEATETIMQMMGTEIRSLAINKDGYMYNLDMNAKTGTKAPVISNTTIDFKNLTDQMEKDMNLKKLGKEDFLGRKCEKMSIDYTKMQMTGTFLVYRGVPLKVDTDMGSMKMVLEAQNFEENANVPADVFEIPADFTITGN